MDAERISQRAFELHEGCSMPLCQAVELALKEAAGPIWPCAKLVIRDGRVSLESHQYAPGLPDGEHDVYPLPVDSNAKPMPDFDAVRDKRMSELTPEQQDDARELWLRDQRGWFSEHIDFLLKRLDAARNAGVPVNPEASDGDVTRAEWTSHDGA